MKADDSNGGRRSAHSYLFLGFRFPRVLIEPTMEAIGVQLYHPRFFVGVEKSKDKTDWRISG